MSNGNDVTYAQKLRQDSKDKRPKERKAKHKRQSAKHCGR